MSRTYGAPWSLLLKGLTIGVITIMAVVCAVSWNQSGGDRLLGFVMALPLLVVLIAGFWAVLGYEINGDVLEIRRPGRVTRVPLRGLRDVREDPEAMKRALRVFGNGGMFAFTGIFHNKRVGRFHAYVTDRGRAVFLELADGKKIAVSPDDPRGFVRRVRSAAGLKEDA